MASAFAAIPNTTIVIVGPLPIACVSVVAVIHQKPTVGFISRWTVFKYVFFFRDFLENVPCSQEIRTRQVLYSLGTCQFLSWFLRIIRYGLLCIMCLLQSFTWIIIDGLLCILVLHTCINDRWFMFWFLRKAFLFTVDASIVDFTLIFAWIGELWYAGWNMWSVDSVNVTGTKLLGFHGPFTPH